VGKRSFEAGVRDGHPVAVYLDSKPQTPQVWLHFEEKTGAHPIFATMLPQIGDFIVIASLAAKAVNALDSSRGSKFEFTSLLHSLKALGQAMLRAEALCMECHTSSFDAYMDPHRADLLNAIASDISKERKECEALVSHFLTSFKPYHAAFAQSHNGKIHRGFKELTWMWRKEEAAMLERRLDGHVRAMQLHLWTFYQWVPKSSLS
jgi:hypothetical protein